MGAQQLDDFVHGVTQLFEIFVLDNSKWLLGGQRPLGHVLFEYVRLLAAKNRCLHTKRSIDLEALLSRWFVHKKAMLLEVWSEGLRRQVKSKFSVALPALVDHIFLRCRFRLYVHLYVQFGASASLLEPQFA